MSPCPEAWQMVGLGECAVKGPVGEVEVATPMHSVGTPGDSMESRSGPENHIT